MPAMVTLVWLAYPVTLLLIVILAVLRSGRAEWTKALSAVGSLALLAGVAAERMTMTGGSSTGGIAVGLALSSSMIIGTGLDPMNAVVHWPGEWSTKRSVRQLIRRRRDGDDAPARLERRKSAAPTLTLFVLFSVAFWLINPEWF